MKYKRISEINLSIISNIYKINKLNEKFNLNNVEFFNILNDQNIKISKTINKASYIIDIKIPMSNELYVILDEYISNSFINIIDKNNILLNILKYIKEKCL